MSGRVQAWWLWMLGALLLVGCRGPVADIQLGGEAADNAAIQFAAIAERELDTALLKPPTGPYKIGIGDILEIEIAGVSGSRDTTFVMPDGRIYFDLAGGVRADGLTVTELSAALEAALARDYAAPKVSVGIKEVRSRRVWVLGRVSQPGLYPLKQPTSLLEAISMAGGLATSRFSGSTEELADLSNSFLLREGQVLPVDFVALMQRGDMRHNVQLRDGDYIYLPSSLSRYVQVMGAVMQPQVIGFRDRLTLVGALARARGASAAADLKRVVVIRGSRQDPQVALVNLEDILAGRARNVDLEPMDIVWVPERRWQFLERYLWLILDSSARTVAVREGSNAVETDLAGPEIVIPINP